MERDDFLFAEDGIEVAPVEEAPVEEAPVEEAPVEEAPVAIASTAPTTQLVRPRTKALHLPQ